MSQNKNIKPTPPPSQIIKEGHDPKPRVDKDRLAQSIRDKKKILASQQIVKK